MISKIPGSAINRLFQPQTVLLSLILFTIAYFFLAHEGFYFNDDFYYAEMAANLANGSFIPQNLPAYHRFMIFAPAAIILNLTGISINTLTLWPLLCTLSSLLVIYFLFRKEDKLVTVFALVLTGLHFHTLFLSIYFFPDNIIQFFALASAGVLYAVRRNGGQAVGFALLFVLCNFAALLSKETIVWYLPFYLFVAGYDIFRKKHTVFWLASVGFGIVVLGAYLYSYNYYFGSYLFRFTMVEATHLVMAQSEAYRNIDLYDRFIKAPLPFFIGSGIFFPIAFCFYFFRKRLNAGSFSPDSGENFWMILALSTLLLFWFGTTSVTSYRPITLVPRMASLLIPPLGIAAAYQLRNYILKPEKPLWFGLPLIAAAVYSWSAMSVVYGLPGLYFFFCSFYKEPLDSQKHFGFFCLILTVSLALRPLHFMLKPTISSFTEQEKVVKSFIAKSDSETFLFADGWLEKSQRYYSGFKPQQKLKILNYEQSDTVGYLGKSEAYLLINKSTLSNPDLQYKTPQPGFTITEKEIHQWFPEKELILQKGKVSLYKLKLKMPLGNKIEKQF